ncbi:DUF5956 family protein [Actinoplanes sp. CA-015351]|uniref:DUF5956 family protein n=1 Tax=Actinoplanes sp. CA-015351 TaxID=3239897 RepID=UPI003D9685C1
MTSAWENAGMLPFGPPDDLAEGDVVVTDQGTYWECGSTDWHLMLGWFAGPDTLRRWPDDRVRFWTVIEEDAAGNRQVSQQPVTGSELAGDDDEATVLLAERGIPALPGGFRWFQLVPPGRTGGDVVAAYRRVQRELPQRYDMALETAYARAAVEELYGLPVTPPPPIPASWWEPEPENPRHTARMRAEHARQAELLSGPPGAVPILRCRDLRRSLAFYATLGFRGEELSGYAVLRHPAAELHLSETSDVSPGGCLIRVPDAAALWHSLDGRLTLGPLDHDNPGMATFTLLDPDNNHLRVVSIR